MVNKRVIKNKYHDFLFREVLLYNKHHANIEYFQSLLKNNSAGDFFIENKIEYEEEDIVPHNFFKQDSIIFKKEKRTFEVGFVILAIFLIVIFFFFSTLVIQDYCNGVRNRHLGLIIISIVAGFIYLLYLNA